MKKYFLPIVLTFTFLHFSVQAKKNRQEITKSKSIKKYMPARRLKSDKLAKNKDKAVNKAECLESPSCAFIKGFKVAIQAYILAVVIWFLSSIVVYTWIAKVLHLKEDAFFDGVIELKDAITFFVVVLFFIKKKFKEESATKKEKNKKNYTKKILCLTLPVQIIALIMHIVYSIRCDIESHDDEVAPQANNLPGPDLDHAPNHPNNPIANFHIESHEQGLLLYADSQNKNTILHALAHKQAAPQNQQSSCFHCLEVYPLPKYILRIDHRYPSRDHAGQQVHCLNHKDGYCVKCLSNTTNLNDLIQNEWLCGHCSGIHFPFLLGSDQLAAENTRTLLLDFFQQEVGQNLLQECEEQFDDDQLEEPELESVELEDALQQEAGQNLLQECEEHDSDDQLEEPELESGELTDLEDSAK